MVGLGTNFEGFARGSDDGAGKERENASVSVQDPRGGDSDLGPVEVFWPNELGLENQVFLLFFVFSSVNVEWLMCFKPYRRCWGHSGEQDRSVCVPGKLPAP